MYDFTTTVLFTTNILPTPGAASSWCVPEISTGTMYSGAGFGTMKVDAEFVSLQDGPDERLKMTIPIISKVCFLPFDALGFIYPICFTS